MTKPRCTASIFQRILSLEMWEAGAISQKETGRCNMSVVAAVAPETAASLETQDDTTGMSPTLSGNKVYWPFKFLKQTSITRPFDRREHKNNG